MNTLSNNTNASPMGNTSVHGSLYRQNTDRKWRRQSMIEAKEEMRKEMRKLSVDFVMNSCFGQQTLNSDLNLQKTLANTIYEQVT